MSGFEVAEQLVEALVARLDRVDVPGDEPHQSASRRPCAALRTSGAALGSCAIDANTMRASDCPAGRLVARGDVPAQARVAVGQAREAVGDFDQLVDAPVLAQLREQVRDGGVVGAQRDGLLPVVDRGGVVAERDGQVAGHAQDAPALHVGRQRLGALERLGRAVVAGDERLDGADVVGVERQRAARGGMALVGAAEPEQHVGAVRLAERRGGRLDEVRVEPLERRVEPAQPRLDDAGQQQRVGARRVGRERQLRRRRAPGRSARPRAAGRRRRPGTARCRRSPPGRAGHPRRTPRSRCTAAGRRDPRPGRACPPRGGALTSLLGQLLDLPRRVVAVVVAVLVAVVVAVLVAVAVIVVVGHLAANTTRPPAPTCRSHLAPPLEVHEVRERLRDGDAAGVRTEPVAVDAERRLVGVGGPVGQHRAVRAAAARRGARGSRRHGRRRR